MEGVKQEEMKTEKIEIEKLLSEGKTIQLSPIGYSMYPLFVPGRDMARIAPSDGARLKRGDVALYRRGDVAQDGKERGILVLHRIWKREGDRFYFVGDNQKEIEGPLSVRQIRGELIGFERRGRYVSVKNPVYRLLSALWLRLRPVRPLISGCVHRIKVCFRKKKRF